MELEQIAEENGLLIIDGSVVGSSSFLQDLYDARRFAHLRCRDISDERERIDSFLGFLQNYQEEIISVPGVLDEFKQYVQIIGENLGFFNKTKNHDKHNKKRKSSRRESYWNSVDNCRNEMVALQRSAYDLQNSLHDIVLDFTDERERALFQIINLLSKRIGLKKDNKEVYGMAGKRHNSNPQTDERLCAKLMYSSLFVNPKTSLLTRDTDCFSLLGVSGRLIGSDCFKPYNEFFRSFFERSGAGLNVYFKGNDEGDFSYEPITFSDFPSDCVIFNLDKRESEEVKKRVMGLVSVVYKYNFSDLSLKDL